MGGWSMTCSLLAYNKGSVFGVSFYMVDHYCEAEFLEGVEVNVQLSCGVEINKERRFSEGLLKSSKGFLFLFYWSIAELGSLDFPLYSLIASYESFRKVRFTIL